MSTSGDLLRVVICNGEDENGAALLRHLVAAIGGVPDYAAEDIAPAAGYRSLSTLRRRYLIAELAGSGRELTEWIAAAASADLAIIPVDARSGIQTGTRRGWHLAVLSGVRQVLLAVHGMEALEDATSVLREIEQEAFRFARRLEHGRVATIPVSLAAEDDPNAAGARMPWYRGPTLREVLEQTEAAPPEGPAAFRLPVESVETTDTALRACTGRIVRGRVRPGDRVCVYPAERKATVGRILTRAGDLAEAVAGQTVTLALDDDIEVSSGNLIAGAEGVPEVADQFEATLMWTGRAPMFGGRGYLMKIGTASVTATPDTPKYCIDPDTLEHLAAKTLRAGEVGVCNLSLDRPIAFDPYASCRETGGFILVDRLTNDTVGAGLLHFALRRSHNIHHQAFDIDRVARGALKGQRSAIIWLTGLSGAGKSTIANLVERALYAEGRHTYVLDGDNVRHGLSRNLGFTPADRVENVRRVAEVAKLMADAGLIVLVSLISPYRQERRMARELVEAGGIDFIEVFVDAPLAVAEGRDPKGLYRKARRGELANFTGIDAPYEAPERAELRLDAAGGTPASSAEALLALLRRSGIIR